MTTDSSGATVLALYKRPTDRARFDAHYADTHVPLAKQLPGLQSYSLSHGLTDKDPYYLVAMLRFPSADAASNALASPQGQAVVADLENFAQAGVDIMVFENTPA